MELEFARPGWMQCRNPNCRADRGFIEDPNRGDVVCTSCGLVYSEKLIDQGSEWRNFSDSDTDKSRADKVDPLLENLATNISAQKYNETTGSGNSALSKIQRRVALDSSQRNLTQAIDKVNEFGEILHLPSNITDKAKYIYKKFDETKKRTIRGSKTDGIIAAVIYLACKEEGVPRTFKELGRETGINEKDIRKLYRVLTRELPSNAFTSRSNVVAPADLVHRFCSKLKLPPSVMTEAANIARKAAPKLEGKSPNSIAAASIFMATKGSDQKRWEKDIAKAASISAATIRNIYKEMLPWSDELLPAGQEPPQDE